MATCRSGLLEWRFDPLKPGRFQRLGLALGYAEAFAAASVRHGLLHSVAQVRPFQTPVRPAVGASCWRFRWAIVSGCSSRLRTLLRS